MKLLRLKLQNFKGIKEFELDTKGDNVEVYGDNATGKTSLFDAFTWLLFGKDSSGKTDFEIKTLDEEGNVIHGLEHSVEGTFQIGDKELTLQKIYKEKWTKKRGSAEAQFTGHTTDYFIDDVPVKKKEYEERVSDIVDENVFKLLTSPTYFNEQLHWQKRRKILLAVCGDVTTEEVINSNGGLEKLPDILGDRSIEDHRKYLASQKKKINKELEAIPVRISEVQNSLPDISDISDSKALNSDIDKLNKQIEEKQNEKSRVENGGEIAEKQKKLAELDSELLEIKNKHRENNDKELEEKQRALNDGKNKVSELNSSINAKQKEIESNEKHIQRLEDKMQNLRQKWQEKNAEEFDDSGIEDTCYACGQSLPAEKVEEAKEKAKEQFNKQKSEKLEEIQAEGKSLRQEADQLQEQNQKLQSEIDELIKGKEQYSQYTELEKEIQQIKENMTDISENQEYQAKLKEKNELERQIENIKEDNNYFIEKINQEIQKLRDQVSLLEGAKHRLEQHEKGQKRIEELKSQEKELAKEYEKLEQEDYLCEEFIRTKVDLLEEKINSKFEMARFILFKQNINGGIEETCQVMYNGVPYSSLNNGARINIGLDIINTLSDHYGFEAPIFIDNKEAITRLIETKGQVISLVVSEKDKELRVEHEQETQKEAI